MKLSKALGRGRRWTLHSAILGVSAFALVLALDSTLPGAASASLSDEAKADVLTERGARALRKGDVRGSLEYLARAYDLNPRDSGVQAQYARALLAAGRTRQAARVLDDLSERGETDADDDLILGLATFRLGEYAEARDHLERSLAKKPDDAIAELFLGAALVELDEDAEAKPHLAAAERLDPSLAPHVAFRRGRIAMLNGDTTRAQKFFNEVQQRAPGSRIAQAAREQMEGAPPTARRWGAYMTLGMAYDTNVNVAGQAQTGNSRRNDIRFFTELGADVMLFQNEKFSLQAGAAQFLSRNDKVHTFDVEASRAWAVAAYEATEQVTFDARYAFEYSWTDMNHWYRFRQVNAVEPGVRVKLHRDFLTRLFWRYEDQNFYFPTGGLLQLQPGGPIFDLDQNGDVKIAGFEQYWFAPDFTGWGSGFLRLGYRHREESTKGNQFDSNSNQPNLMIGMPLPQKLFGMIVTSFEWRHYGEPSVFEVGAGNRRDKIFLIQGILRRPVMDRVTAELSYQFWDWDSNVAFYKFKRHIAHFLVTYTY